MIRSLKELYKSELMYPSFLSIFINPFYFIRKGLLDGIKKNGHYMTGVMMDFGCADSPYRQFFNVEKYIGLDIAESGHDHSRGEVDVLYDGKKLPFEDNTFDSILSTEVFEHIFNIEEVLGELYRVLKPGGNILLTVPFVWEEHEVPYDFGRYTSFGLYHLLTKNGFKIIKQEKSTNYVETVIQMWITYLCRSVLPKKRYVGPIISTLIIFPLNLLGIILSRILPMNEAFYHNNIIVAWKNRSLIGSRNHAAL